MNLTIDEIERRIYADGHPALPFLQLALGDVPTIEELEQHVERLEDDVCTAQDERDEATKDHEWAVFALQAIAAALLNQDARHTLATRALRLSKALVRFREYPGYHDAKAYRAELEAILTP